MANMKEAARKAWVTRRKNESIAAAKRSYIARKAWATRRAK